MYRNDVAALQDRLGALEAEVAERTRARDEVARMLHDARAHARQEAVFAELADGGLVRRRRRIAIAALVALASVFVLIVGVSVLVSVLGASGATSTERRIADGIRHFERFTDEMCQCTDASCAQRVADAMTRWGQDRHAHGAMHADRDDALGAAVSYFFGRNPRT